ncbi:LysR family transcriptional regulator [Mesorhizobium sp. VK9D]|uniref:LysR family transcriptional regulator n=1 Tax=Mesorhizobium australafricanum TaxID=3072311 RepID=UPI002A24BD66|nr:LysR family transcriptional regulator [Mesorhizobium sp. VK9D]MDX8452221.1 LysR family transcriptional regulator [Mesorhizobium sp. VK9D]
MNDRLQQLAIFVRTVETGSFSRVAREFGLSQPSVSRTVAALEDRLGVKLLARTTRQLSLTDAGEALLARARDALAGVEEAENAARGADRLSGMLRVAMPPTFGVRQIVPLLPAFLEMHPDIRIDLMMSDRYENLIAEGADMALRLGSQPDSSFVTRKLAATRRLFVASPAYLARRGRLENLADLGLHHIVGGPGDEGEQNWTARRNGVEEMQRVEPRVRTHAAIGAVTCASVGLGIAIASAWMCADELASGRLVEVLADYRLEPMTAYAVFPDGRRLPQRARAFSDYLQRSLVSDA